MLKKGDNNAVIGSYISRSNIKFGHNKLNPFCNNPLKYVLKRNLILEYDFNNIFIKPSLKISCHYSLFIIII